jgi:phosphatidylinositol 4-kinase A
MKPILDRMIHDIVESLSGPERDFYDREFGFFGEVTSISGKLKPYIKKPKPEKKVNPVNWGKRMVLTPGGRQRLMRRWQK